MEKIEGIVLKKVPFQERHLIISLLCRTGQKISLMIYGGQGGGKNKKGAQVEVGFLLSAQLSLNQTNGKSIYTVKESIVKWRHESIREKYQAFYLLCFFLETIEKMAPTEVAEGQENESLFRLLSNSIFYLDASCKKNQLNCLNHLMVFLPKLLIELGVAPALETCMFCQAVLNGQNVGNLLAQEGGYVCQACLLDHDHKAELDQGAQDNFLVLKAVKSMKYLECQSFPFSGKENFNQLYYYFCHQFQLDPKAIRSHNTLQVYGFPR
jgi:DNA repair protein RecO